MNATNGEFTQKETHRVLIVDDEDLIVHALERVMRRQGYEQVQTTTDSRMVLSLFQEFQPDIVLLDLHMPGLDGLALLQQLGSRVPDDQFLPLVVLSGDMTAEAKQRALALGASDFVAKPYDAAEVTLRVRNLLRLRDFTGRLEDRVVERTRQLKSAEVDVANRMALVAEYRDYEDGAHVQRVGQLSAAIAQNLDRPAAEVELLRYAAPLHDIGKIAIPDSILLKPGPLSLDELDVMKAHTTIGARMLAGSNSPILQMAEEIALYHHENWDGTGYTPGLRGEQIPLSGRIVSVADVFDALTHARPYKTAWTLDETLGWMQSMRDRKFDARVLDGLLRAAHTLEQIESASEHVPPEAQLPILADVSAAASA